MMMVIPAVDAQSPTWIKDVGVPIFTFLLGVFVTRFTMSKKERKDYLLTLQKNAETYLSAISDAFEVFTAEMAKIVQSSGQPSFDQFIAVTQSGEAYFTQLKIVCDAAFAGTIPSESIASTFSPLIKEAWERSIPNYYNTLSAVARRYGFQWNGELRRRNYERIAAFYEKFCLDNGICKNQDVDTHASAIEKDSH